MAIRIIIVLVQQHIITIKVLHLDLLTDHSQGQLNARFEQKDRQLIKLHQAFILIANELANKRCRCHCNL